MILSFTVPGECRGKGRPRFVHSPKSGKSWAHVDEKTAVYENLVKICAEQAMRDIEMTAPTNKPVKVTIIAYFVPPLSWSAKKKKEALSGVIKHIVKPDDDNINKIIKDGMNKVVYLDDSQCFGSCVFKWYAEMSRTDVTVEIYE